MESRFGKQTILLIIVFIVFIFSFVVFTFAIFSYRRTSSNNQTIETGKLTLGYVEETNGINIINALPTSDLDVLGTTNTDFYFDFYVTYDISSQIEINYEIDIENMTSQILDKNDSLKQLETSRIKIALEDRSKPYPDHSLTVAPIYFSDLEKEKASNDKNGYKLYSKTTSSSQIDYYRLYMWLAEKDSNGLDIPLIDIKTQEGTVIAGINNKTFSVRVNVQALAQIKD